MCQDKEQRGGWFLIYTARIAAGVYVGEYCKLPGYCGEQLFYYKKIKVKLIAHSEKDSITEGKKIFQQEKNECIEPATIAYIDEQGDTVMGNFIYKKD